MSLRLLAPNSNTRAVRQVQSSHLLAVVCVVITLGALPAARGVTLKQVSSSKPKPGIEVRHYTTKAPTTHVWATYVDLCTARIHVDATKPPSGLSSVGAWGAKTGATVAINADFYKTGPVRVYGNAVGLGVPWPAKQTGTWSGYKSEWYYLNYGWIGLLHDELQFSHTKHTKKNAAALGISQGWSPTNVTTSIPAGVVGLVSGFPALVIEGKQVTCAKVSDKSCFPDRGDFKVRHPRTAIGFDSSRHKLILAVVDGRTSKSAGMNGPELAELLKKLGAWQAFNLDGGGSSQMWLADKGYVNDVKGNNSGGATRSVANHLGIFTGSAQPARAGHCQGVAACQLLPAKGGVIDNSGPCFRPFGPNKYWRTEQGGNGGTLRWTDASSGDVPGNWAWWRIELAQAGTYRLEYSAVAKWAVHTTVRYELRAAGKTHALTVNQSKGSTWRTLGDFTFAKGGRQWLAVFDNNGSKVANDLHIIADAIRLTRLGSWCGDAKCDGAETCGSCAQDCGKCPTCGDGTCNAKEDCATCAKDCGECPDPPADDPPLDAGSTDVQSADAGYTDAVAVDDAVAADDAGAGGDMVQDQSARFADGAVAASDVSAPDVSAPDVARTDSRARAFDAALDAGVVVMADASTPATADASVPGVDDGGLCSASRRGERGPIAPLLLMALATVWAIRRRSLLK